MTLAARIPPGSDPALGSVRRGRTSAAVEPRSAGSAGRPPWRRWLRAAVVLAIASALFSAPWWVRRALSRMELFRLRQVEILGSRFLSDADIMARLAVDTTTSVWTDLSTLERRLARHPQVASVELSRRLPGTLSVRLTEHIPVALVPFGATMRVLDAEGRSLPIDPTRVPLDLPLVMQRDSAVLRMLGAVRERDAALFRRISEVRAGAGRELQLTLTTDAAGSPADSTRVAPPQLVVRAMVGVSPERLGELWAVEADLSRRGIRAAELDLRYRDQVVARLQ